jgi:DNA-binding MarR family transcriptional regulator
MDIAQNVSLYTDLFTELVRVEIELWNELDAHLNAEAGITLPQFQALTAIRNKGGQTRVQDISAEMSITVGATSKVVDRLERDGLAVRSANPDDRRSSLVSLSERGAAAVASGDAAAEEHLRTSLGGVLSGPAASRLLAELTSLRDANRARVAR